jgi:crotonobetainyl-CoA:carnitine CoA-transferase CaiB-like acyl-CoA transferase
MLLCDNGAAVTRIEPPGGDPFRKLLSGYRAWNRGKRSAIMNLKEPQERARLIALATEADVFLDSFSPGVTERLGIDYATLGALNPRLIYCSITGYGALRAHRDRPAYDALVAARLGLQWEQRSWPGGPIDHILGLPGPLPELEMPEGAAQGSPREGPIFTWSFWPSLAAAYLAATGISAALLAREFTGRGQHVQTSLFQAAQALTTSKWQRAENPDTPGYKTWIYDRRRVKGFFQCSDGRWIQQWVGNPKFLISSADGDTLELRRETKNQRDDPDRIDTSPYNVALWAQYYRAMADAVARFPHDQWVRLAAEANVPLQTVRTPEEALQDPVLIREGTVAEVDDPELGRLRQAGSLYNMEKTPGRIQGGAPVAGQHTAAVIAAADAMAARGPIAKSSATSSNPALRRHAPLDGVTVLDLGTAVAGPYGTQVLADLGANVIKVNSRRDPYWFATHIAYGCNRGKRSIAIDLKNPKGLEVLYRLVRIADVVHMNIRKKAAERIGVDESSIRTVNPNIIYCHTRGFEKVGPRADSPGNDQTGNSLAGTTWEDGGCADGGTPFWSLTSMGDTGNGFLSAIAVIQALYHRRRTGEAQRVDTSIINAGMLNASHASLMPNGEGIPRHHLDGMQLGLSALYRLYQTAQGWLCIAVITEAQWRAFAQVPDAKHLAQDPRFATGKSRSANDKALATELEHLLATRPAAQWFEILDRAGIPCEVSNETFPREMFRDPELREQGLLVSLKHEQLGKVEQFGHLISFSDTPGRIFGAPPLVGQHTREIMRENGYADTEIEALCAQRAVFESVTLS